MISTSLTLLAPLLLGGVGLFCLMRGRPSKHEYAAQQTFSRRLLETQEKERKRIAAELHDSIGQDLLIVKSRAELSLASVTNGSPAAQQLQEISKTASLIIERTRQITQSLGPHHLEQLGLAEALDAMIDRVEAATAIRFERKLEPVDEVFTLESATSLYRIAQEALNNLMKHAQPASAQVHLIRDLHHVQLAILDNGRGFDVAKVRNRPGNGSFGLAEIRERVRILGGRLEIESQPGAGTHLAVTVPLKDGEKV